MSSRKSPGRILAKFFCDNCGAEVPLQAPSCPRCGRPFSSVRCPKCGFAGPPRAFSSGCPSCGYAAPREEGKRSEEGNQGTKPTFPIPKAVYTSAAIGLAVLLLASILVLVLRISR
jgi:predicted RNA-binding Zn-ribbon protein involved in translation (DUF1610 family)